MWLPNLALKNIFLRHAAGFRADQFIVHSFIHLLRQDCRKARVMLIEATLLIEKKKKEKRGKKRRDERKKIKKKKRSQMCMWERGIKLDRLDILLTQLELGFLNQYRPHNIVWHGNTLSGSCLERRYWFKKSSIWSAAQRFRQPVNFVDRRSGAIAAAFQCAMYNIKSAYVLLIIFLAHLRVTGN